MHKMLTTEETQLDNLNADCLRRIFLYLGIEDKIKAMVAYRPFADAASSLIAKETINFTPDICLCLKNTINDFIIQYGWILKRIYVEDGPSISDFPRRYFQLLNQHCRNLEEIYVRLNNDLWEKHMSLLFAQPFENLRVLKIHAREIRTVSDVLKKMQQLQVVHINSEYFTGVGLDALTNLEELSLIGCYKLQSKLMTDVLYRNANLKKIGLVLLNGVINFPPKSDIGWLRIDSGTFCRSKVPRLRNLRHVYVTNHSTDIEILRLLAKYYSTTLESLRFRTCDPNVLQWISSRFCAIRWLRMYSGVDISESAITSTVRSFKDLRYMDLENVCYDVDLYNEIVAIRQENRAKSPLTIALNEDRLSEDFMGYYQSCRLHRWVRITFDHEYPDAFFADEEGQNFFRSSMIF